MNSFCYALAPERFFEREHCAHNFENWGTMSETRFETSALKELDNWGDLKDVETKVTQSRIGGPRPSTSTVLFPLAFPAGATRRKTWHEKRGFCQRPVT